MTVFPLLFPFCVFIQPPSTPATKPTPPTNKTEFGSQSPQPAKPPMTDAEKIANAQDTIKQAKQAIEKIQKSLDDPEGEYHKSEAEFMPLNTRLKELKAQITKYQTEGDKKKAAESEAALAAMQEEWQLAKERFDIAIRKKKESQEAIAALKERINAEQELLNRLEGKVPPPTAPKPSETTKPDPETLNPDQPATPPTPPTSGKPTPNETPAPAETGAPATSVGSAMSGMIAPGLPGSTPTPATRPSVPSEPAPVEDDPAVTKLKERLGKEKAALKDTEERVRLANERIRAMQRSIQTSNKSLVIEKESIANMEKAIAKLTDEPAKTVAEEKTRAARLAETRERLSESKVRLEKIIERIAGLQVTLETLRDDLKAVTAEADAKRDVVKATEAEIASMVSPFAPRNLFHWLIRKGPHLGLIIIGMVLLHLAARQFSRHIVRFITRHSDRGSPEDRENRAQTLVGVFRYASGLIIYGGGAVMLLDEMGVPVVPLMGGAAVLGLAVAFGAQNLIRDYFTGFMMLMEDQYSVNDVVKIGAIAGLVEQITLRMTVLRDLEGVRHFIPHGTVTSVSNLTHGWSRALIDVPVAYKENVDKVIDVLMQLGRDMRNDPNLGIYILEEPEMLGVDAFADSGVVIKFLLKTRPLRQWPIKRELLRRIKNRFDELGIEIPFPHRTVYLRYPEGMHPQNTLS